MEKNKEQKFERYQNFVFDLLQDEVLTVEKQEELLALQRPSVGDNVPNELEQIFRTSQPLTRAKNKT